MHCPDWLSPVGKEYWRKHHKLFVIPDELEETFAMLCECYAQFREENSHKALEHYRQLLKLFVDKPRMEKDEFGL